MIKKKILPTKDALTFFMCLLHCTYTPWNIYDKKKDVAPKMRKRAN